MIFPLDWEGVVALVATALLAAGALAALAAAVRPE